MFLSLMCCWCSRALQQLQLGTQSLSRDDIQAALVQFKAKLMERNVAEEIAAKWVQCFASIVASAVHIREDESEVVRVRT